MARKKIADLEAEITDLKAQVETLERKKLGAEREICALKREVSGVRENLQREVESLGAEHEREKKRLLQRISNLEGNLLFFAMNIDLYETLVFNGEGE